VSNVLQHLAGPLAVLRGGLSRLRGRRLRASRLYLEVTHRCNLRCIACYTTAGAEKPDALSLEERKSVVAQAARMGAKVVSLSGSGEPLLYGDLFPLVDYILNLGMRVVMFTNGTVVDAEVARSLIARDVVVYFQLPSLRPEVLDRVTGRKLEIDCTKFGSGAYSVPISVEELEFKTKADFVLAIETAGMFQRLNNHSFWQTANCILVSMGGVPTRACRRFIRRLSEENGIPVYAFVDGDPYGYGNIYRTLKVGSGNAAHINEFFCVPEASFLGVTPDDVEKYDLPTHPLSQTDVKRAKDLMRNDPFFKHHKPWQRAIKKMLQMGQRVEQQAFAKHSLNFVIDTYLPEKLAATDKFLP